MSAIYTAHDLIDEMLACMDADAALVALTNAATGKTEEGPWREEVRSRARTWLRARAARLPGDEEALAWARGMGFLQRYAGHPNGFWVRTEDIGPLVRAALHCWGPGSPEAISELETRSSQ
jgi:hypothetical protein